MNELLLGLDIGTTHCKAGLFDLNGHNLKLAMRKTEIHQERDGSFYYEPEEIWRQVMALIKEVTAGLGFESRVAAIGVAGMAETGMLLEAVTGAARSPMIPWFDKSTIVEAEKLERSIDLGERFRKSGQQLSYKYGLLKLLRLKEKNPESLKNSVWLSVPDYIVYRLTGKQVTDFSLAIRTYAFRLDRKLWDEEWLREFGINPAIFPEAKPSGIPAGQLRPEIAGVLGLTAGMPVAVAGHDHVCAAFAVGAVEPGVILDSVGTAETLMGAIPERELGLVEFQSGFCYGCHVAPDRFYWLGSNSAAGGSVEWLRSQIFQEDSGYEEMFSLLNNAGNKPTGILYYPYLSGSGAPQPDSKTRGAFIGLTASHNRADLLKAVLEGIAYEMESIRRAAESVTDTSIHRVVAVGGGAKNRHWMQIKADISGCNINVFPFPEATLLGAALITGIGSGYYQDTTQALKTVALSEPEEIRPGPGQTEQYRFWYENGYLNMQKPIRDFSRNSFMDGLK